MEDAMVINKGSYQRGFAHGTVIKVERINLAELSNARFGRKSDCEVVFCGEPNDIRPVSLDADGLPIQGRCYQYGDFYYWFVIKILEKNIFFILVLLI